MRKLVKKIIKTLGKIGIPRHESYVVLSEDPEIELLEDDYVLTMMTSDMALIKVMEQHGMTFTVGMMEISAAYNRRTC